MLKRRFPLTRRPHTKALRRCFIIVLLAVALGTPPAHPTRAGQVAPGRAPSPERLQNPDSMLDPPTSVNGTPDLGAWEAILDGARGSANKPASRFAASTTGWNALPNLGLDLRVRALEVVGSNLFAGGRFTQTGDGSVTNLGCIARYDTVGRIWNALPNQGLSEGITALAVVDSDLYAGGWFTQTVDGAVFNLGYVAQYDMTTGTWNALANQGLNMGIFALAVVGSDLYVGGLFTEIGNGSVSNLGRIARYDAVAGTWHELPSQGLNGSVYVLAADGSDVYVGGGFTQTGDGTVPNLGHIARYDTTVAGVWNALPNEGLNGDVTALAMAGSDIYVGGSFTQTGDGAVTDLGHIARYDAVSGTWHALSNQGLNDIVFALAVVGNDLYVGGAFDQTGDGLVTSLGYISRYDTVSGTWHELPNQGLNNWVYVVTVVDSDLYVVGEFNQIGEGIVTGLGHIARFGNVDSKVFLPLVIRQ